MRVPNERIIDDHPSYGVIVGFWDGAFEACQNGREGLPLLSTYFCEINITYGQTIGLAKVGETTTRGGRGTGGGRYYCSARRIAEQSSCILSSISECLLALADRAAGTWEPNAQRLTRMRQNGTVKFFNASKGYGFITPDDGGKDVFVHVTAVERSGIGQLNDGMRISFETEPDKRGKGPKAVDLQAAT
jgi:CspA family cold shock protein